VTRSEFTEAVWRHYAAHNSVKESLDRAQVVWWHDRNSGSVHNWRLSMMGIQQLLTRPVYITGTRYDVKNQSIRITPRLLMNFSRLNFAWCPIFYQTITKEQMINTVWMFNEQANFWMKLCGEDFHTFLNSWSGDSQQH
jgi:hypothetical protein